MTQKEPPYYDPADEDMKASEDAMQAYYEAEADRLCQEALDQQAANAAAQEAQEAAEAYADAESHAINDAED